MNEQVWYVYQNAQQIGPFDNQQVEQLFVNKMIAQDAYIFKVGWKDWRPIEEAFEELGFGKVSAPATEHDKAKRRASAPRASVSGRVVVHNNGQLAIGKGVNISATGIFVETEEQLFTIGEQLKLSVRCDGLSRAFNVMAQVIRYNSDPRYPIGYGLRFEDLDPAIQRDIDRLVQEQNVKPDTVSGVAIR